MRMTFDNVNFWADAIHAFTERSLVFTCGYDEDNNEWWLELTGGY